MNHSAVGDGTTANKAILRNSLINIYDFLWFVYVPNEEKSV